MTPFNYRLIYLWMKNIKNSCTVYYSIQLLQISVCCHRGAQLASWPHTPVNAQLFLSRAWWISSKCSPNSLISAFDDLAELQWRWDVVQPSPNNQGWVQYCCCWALLRRCTAAGAGALCKSCAICDASSLEKLPMYFHGRHHRTSSLGLSRESQRKAIEDSGRGWSIFKGRGMISQPYWGQRGVDNQLGASLRDVGWYLSLTEVKEELITMSPA